VKQHQSEKEEDARVESKSLEDVLKAQYQRIKEIFGQKELEVANLDALKQEVLESLHAHSDGFDHIRMKFTQTQKYLYLYCS
jgi:Tfp pilus assembly protein PilO